VTITFPPMTGAVRTTGPTAEPARAAGQAMASNWPLGAWVANGEGLVPPPMAMPSAHAIVPEAMTGPLSVRTECSITGWYPEPVVWPAGDP
jgi:hypothetical protein